MEGRESQARVEAQRSFTAAKPPITSIKKTKKGRRRVLADLTNSDSPIAGLTPASLCMCDVGSPVSISSPGTPGTPGMGEDILRSQVQLLLQQVQLDAPRAPIFGALLEVGVPCSPGMLVGPTPANTPALSQPSTPVVVPGSKSRLSRTFYAFQGSPGEESGELGPDSSPEIDESVEEGSREKVDLNENICKGSKLSGELPLRRAISEISKITIAETVVSERQISLSDLYITRSLDFDSVLKDMTEQEAKEDSLSTPKAPTKLEERFE